MTAGQVWRRPDGMRWVEVQTAAVDPSGWRLLIPLVDLDHAPDAPPLVVTVDGQRARVHLVTSAPDDDLGTMDGQLSPQAVTALQAALRALVAETT